MSPSSSMVVRSALSSPLTVSKKLCRVVSKTSPRPDSRYSWNSDADSVRVRLPSSSLRYSSNFLSSFDVSNATASSLAHNSCAVLAASPNRGGTTGKLVINLLNIGSAARSRPRLRRRSFESCMTSSSSMSKLRADKATSCKWSHSSNTT